MSTMFVYGNYIMLYRPNHIVIERGFLYPFQGKDGLVYVSIYDYLILSISVIVLISSVFAANRFRKK